MIYEFQCECGETYIGDSPDDDIHIQNAAGEECGKKGELMRYYKFPRPRIPKNALRPKYL